MIPQSLTCPNCGANLKVKVNQTLVDCAYCKTTVRINENVGQQLPPIDWQMISDLPDGKRFISDGSLLLNIEYVGVNSLPTKNVPAQTTQRLLIWNTNHEFKFADLQTEGSSGHYLAPHNILLNKKYIDYLKQVLPEDQAPRFRGGGATDPVLIVHNGVVIGAIMPLQR
jgi:hypothetical protein